MLKRISLLTNISFEPYWETYIKDRFSCLSSDIQINAVLYDAYQDNIDNIRFAEIIVVCLNYEAFYTNLSNDISSGKVTYEAVEADCINKCRELYSYVKTHGNASVVWFGFEDYYFPHSSNYGSLLFFDGLVERLNLVLNDMLKEDSFIDFKRLIAIVGMKNAYDTKGKYRWNAPYSKELISLMVDEIYKQHLITTGNTKKCLVLDCDNVLWGGVLSEDGIEGIRLDSCGLGREYQEFQRFLLNLYYHGVILTVCSKNDKSDVLRVFREHSGMLLREEHIASFKVNWSDKPSNIQMIADELNIGTDSMVFVDDSIFEIEAVKSNLPEVTAIRYDRESMYNEFSCFNLKSKVSLSDVEKRNAVYRTNQRREELKQNCSSYEDYIKSLDIKVDIHKVLPTEYSRIAELTQRTNKCTNGKRYTVNAMKERLLLNDVIFYSVSVSDRFSDLGIVGAIEIEKNDLKLFSLSCRALGRNVENEMVNYVLNGHCVRNMEFKLTENNKTLYNILNKSFPNATFCGF